MDLAAFLEPGLHPVFLHRAGARCGHWGHVLKRPGRRASFLCRGAGPVRGAFTLAIDLPGYSLAGDGSLCPAPGGLAPVRLEAHVSSARSWPGRAVFVMRFRRLVRVLD
ncbi:MAG: hypothetical protein LBT40_11730 [Deltaproteobacteria bacterium]|jgi:hypothetical protein|nr:hypothetical protein [Deltaproteobacteria bacterium]